MAVTVEQSFIYIMLHMVVKKITLQCIIPLWLGPAVVCSIALGDITEKVNPPAAACGHGTHTQMLYMVHVGHI